jgi:UV DNA damage endonuclease
MPHRVGYCCINTTLQKQNIKTSRGMILRTFVEKGSEYALSLAKQNIADLSTILRWNTENNISVFRIGAGIFPWHHKWLDVDSLSSSILEHLSAIGEYARTNKLRLSTHPDHFIKLASLKQSVVDQSILDLEIDSTLFDLMGYSPSYETPINIHIGQGGNKLEVAKRFISNFNKLSSNLRSRIVVENDDKTGGWSVRELFDLIHSEIGIPITFDYFHHQFHPDNLTEQEAFEIAYSTWPDNVTPLFHYSESKNLNENVSGNPRAHADYVFNIINDYGYTIDIDLEAKAKEKALFKYRELNEK